MVSIIILEWVNVIKLAVECTAINLHYCIFPIYLNDLSVILTLLALLTFRFKKLKHSWTSGVNGINTKWREGGGLVSSVFSSFC